MVSKHVHISYHVSKLGVDIPIHARECPPHYATA